MESACILSIFKNIDSLILKCRGDQNLSGKAVVTVLEGAKLQIYAKCPNFDVLERHKKIIIFDQSWTLKERSFLICGIVD
jgi:hypothetical protein